MHTRQFNGTVRNADGSTAPFSGTFTESGVPVIDSVTVVPATAPPGTPRTITIIAHDPDGIAITYECSVDGVSLSPTATPGVFIWNG
jgi:hypothetical protein